MIETLSAIIETLITPSIPSTPSTPLSTIGNRCGHNPINPRFFEQPQLHKDRPDVISIAQENVKKFYYHANSWLQSLWLVRGSSRQERSEAREGESIVIGIILHYTELASMRVGVPCHEDGAFKNLSLKFIAQKAGFRKPGDHPDKGIMRVWRVLNRLKMAGYIEVTKRFDKYIDDDGLTKYKGLAAVKRLTPKLFTELGISLQRLGIKRRAARKRLNRRIAAEKKRMLELSDKAKEKLRAIINSGKVGIKRIVSGKYKKYEDARTRKAQAQAEFNRKKEATAHLYELMQQYPEMTAREIQSKYDIQLN